MTTVTFDRSDATVARRISLAILGTGDSPALTVLRLGLALVMLPHGLQKTVGWFGGYGFSATMGWFGSLGIPAVLGFLAILAESAGAVALVAGLGTRIAAFGIGTTMAVAAFTHRANGFFMNWSGAQAGEGIEFHLLAIAIAAALVIAGGGRYAADRALSSSIA
jgi:putative oxidoreductase